MHITGKTTSAMEKLFGGNFRMDVSAFKGAIFRINIPDCIFPGERDVHSDVQVVYDITRAFKEKNKTNLQYFIFGDHHRHLNFADWIVENKMSEGIRKMLGVAEIF
jgi:hypothetical protein